MVDCAACGRAVGSADEPPPLRSEGRFYHLACAAPELLDQVSEEYRAIVRKGIRYFVDKYAGPDSADSDPAPRFLTIGRAVEEERARRAAR